MRITMRSEYARNGNEGRAVQLQDMTSITLESHACVLLITEREENSFTGNGAAFRCYAFVSFGPM